MNANTHTILRALLSLGQIPAKLLRRDGSTTTSTALDVRGATAFQFQYHNVGLADKYVIQGSAVQAEKDTEAFGLDADNEELWVDVQEISRAELDNLEETPNYQKGAINGQQIYPFMRVKVETAGSTSLMIHALRSL